jgi:KaiC/GvpD/RAD55 family RecA-like ATPase
MEKITREEYMKLSNSSLEWKLLATLFEKQEFLRDIQPDIFTEERLEILSAMNQCYIHYGQLDFDGVELFLGREIPPEIINASPINPEIATKKLFQLHLKRVLQKKKDLITQVSLKEVIEESDLLPILELPIFGNDSSRDLPQRPEFIEDLEERLKPAYKGRPTGLQAFDSRIGGEWKPKKVYLLGATAGLGKTTIAANAMLHLALNLGEPTSIFSLEMSKSDLMMKWTAMILGVDSQKLQTGKPEDLLVQNAKEVTAFLHTLPLFVLDDASITLPRIVSEMRYQAKNKGVKTFFLDYLQIVNHFPTNTPNKDLGEVVKTLKKVAKELGVSVIILSQLNKEGTIRDTGEAENHVDVVILMNPDDDGSDGITKALSLEFRKNRLGSVSKTFMFLHGPTNTFTGMDFSRYWQLKSGG